MCLCRSLSCKLVEGSTEVEVANLFFHSPTESVGPQCWAHASCLVTHPSSMSHCIANMCLYSSRNMTYPSASPPGKQPLSPNSNTHPHVVSPVSPGAQALFHTPCCRNPLYGGCSPMLRRWICSLPPPNSSESSNIGAVSRVSLKILTSTVE
jgi:hypothetical protein